MNVYNNALPKNIPAIIPEAALSNSFKSALNVGDIAYLIWVGLKDTKPQTNALPIFFIAPIILIALNILQIGKHELLCYSGYVIIGAMVGVALTWHSNFVIHKHNASISTPGTWQTLLLFMSIFAVRYYFGYQKAISPTFKADLNELESAASGIIAGIFLGKALLYTFKYMMSKKS